MKLRFEFGALAVGNATVVTLVTGLAWLIYDLEDSPSTPSSLACLCHCWGHQLITTEDGYTWPLAEILQPLHFI
jgi:hypothetical protein